jgi:hypothetical protein
MAAPNRRRRGSLANLLGDVIDDTKELVDDALDRAGDLERDVRRGARRLLDNDARPESADEIDSLKAAIDDLTAKVDRLARLREKDKR